MRMQPGLRRLGEIRRTARAGAGRGCILGPVLALLLAASGAAAPDGAAVAAALADALAEEGDLGASRVERRRAELLQGKDAATRPAATPASPPAGSWPPGALPVRILVGFYRVAIGPALGHRCILEPSCSQYSLLAARERGWLGLPMTADRLIRESSVVAARERLVVDGQGHIRIADPVSDHVGAREPRAPSSEESREPAHH